MTRLTKNIVTHAPSEMRRNCARVAGPACVRFGAGSWCLEQPEHFLVQSEDYGSEAAM